jgi:hypothetical protein
MKFRPLFIFVSGYHSPDYAEGGILESCFTLPEREATEVLPIVTPSPLILINNDIR